MIQVKCTNDLCPYALTREELSKTKKKKRKCPKCKSPLKTNITEPSDRKKWHCFHGQEKASIEHAVLVIIDSFSDGSHEIEIPLLGMKFKEREKLQSIYRASDAIADFLKTEFGIAYNNEQQFITIAYQHERDAARRNIPMKDMIFLDVNKPSEMPVDKQ